MASEIHYIPGLNTTENYLKIEQDEGPGTVTALDGTKTEGNTRPANVKANRDDKTLLHLVFWLTHTRDGRNFFREHSLEQGSEGLKQGAKEALIKKFNELGVTDERIQSAIVQSHIAALNYDRAFLGNKPNRAAEMERWEKIYLQHSAFITWCLWEDAKGHEFSMLW